MKNIKITLWGFLFGLTLLWWLSDQTNFANLPDFFAWRAVVMQWSGVTGIGVMSLAMLLVLRPGFVEPWFGGLDKMYRLHKWLGIAGLSVSIGHWLLAKGPKWMVALGWLERRGRKPRPSLPEGSWQQLFQQQRGLAESVGEWAFYIAAVLMILALVKWFPYKRFFQTHRILALTYLALVFHAVILIKFDYWTAPIGAVVAILLALGSVGAVLSLFRRRVGGRRVVGTVTALEWQPAMATLAVEVSLAPGWQGHAAGQFAFVQFHADEGPHPFTIASPWASDGKLHFLIKALGDYTQTLPDRLKIGDAVTVEGPFGQFNFAGSGRRQVWVSGGIGISPFVARLRELGATSLGATSDGRQIDLFHCSREYDAKMANRLIEDADAAQVKLHLFWDQRDGKLDTARLIEQVPDWHEADFWFCGPAGFGRALKQGLVGLGLPAGRFHQELFEMR